MKQKITNLMMAMLLLLGMSSQVFSQGENFTPIDDFEAGISLWWTPDGSGSTAGIVLENAEGDSITYRAPETVIVNPATTSVSSMKLAISWNNTTEYTGTATHLVRQHMPAGNANTAERRFQPGQALEVFLYGDGSGNRFRFMTRDGIPTLEGSAWISIDWTGWKRIVWDYNNPDNVVGWVNGNGEMNGENYYFDSFQITKDEGGTAQGATIYFDDFRIVDPFRVDFNIAGVNGTEVISINNTSFADMESDFTFSPQVYEAGVDTFDLFPGTYQYFVQKDGFVTKSGILEVNDQDVTVDVTLDSGADTEYAVTFSVFNQDEELVSDAVIAIDGVEGDAGDYTFDLTPGFYNYTINKELHFETTGYFTVVDGNLFVTAILNEIPDIFDNVYLSWDVAPTASTTAYKAEYYSVWVAVVANEQQAFDMDDYVMVFEETLSTTSVAYQYQPRKIEISEFQSQDIRVAFRHHNSTDKDRIVIDNIKIEAVDHVNDTIGNLFFEDFDGGVPADFDPLEDETVEYDDTWLPDGWSTFNNDEDTLNWYYAIRLIQGDYQAHMRSQSFADGAALTPDNWLVTPMVEMPMVLFHTVTFDVKDVEGNAITNAVVTFDGEAYEAGVYHFDRTSGTYDYEVNLGEYIPVSGTAVVGREDQTIEITLELPPVYDVTFIVDMRQAAGFEPGTTNVYMTGDFPAWNFDLPGTHPEQLLTIYNDNVFFYSTTLELKAGTYNYKYYDGTSLDDAEWAGEPFRTVVVTNDTIFNDVFGVQVSVDEFTAVDVSLFPNPARDNVQINADSKMDMISIFNLAGQQVYNRRINDVSHIVDLSDFNNGIYMVQVFSGNSAKTYKLQIVK